jgi:hypothetical protein
VEAFRALSLDGERLVVIRAIFDVTVEERVDDLVVAREASAVVVEPSAALGVAAVLDEPERFAGRRSTRTAAGGPVGRRPGLSLGRGGRPSAIVVSSDVGEESSFARARGAPHRPHGPRRSRAAGRCALEGARWKHRQRGSDSRIADVDEGGSPARSGTRWTVR